MEWHETALSQAFKRKTSTKGNNTIHTYSYRSEQIVNSYINSGRSRYFGKEEGGGGGQNLQFLNFGKGGGAKAVLCSNRDFCLMIFFSLYLICQRSGDRHLWTVIPGMNKVKHIFKFNKCLGS